MSTKISATILTFNEEKSIARCLKSLEGVADEIIVVDACSTDATADICRRTPGVKVVVRPMAGYGAQRQYATSLTAHSHVLAIDADEELSPALRASIIRLKEQGLSHRGYAFSRLNFYCGHPVKHCGWYPDTQVRLFDRRYANWNLDDVAEQVIFREHVSPIHVDGDILHYRCDTPDDYDRTIMAQADLWGGRIAGRSDDPISAARPAWESIKAFVDCFVAKGGMMDGNAGRAISISLARATRRAWSRARELRNSNHKN